MKVPRKSSIWLNWVGLIGWAVVFLLALILTGGILYFFGVGVLAGYLPLFSIVMIAAVGHAISRGRKRSVGDILVYLEQTVRLNLPLKSMLWAAERDESFGTAARLSRLGALLDQGRPLAAALAQAVPEMPNRTVQKIAAAENLGQLQTALTRLVRSGRKTPAAPGEEIGFYKAYPPAMLIVLGTVVSGLMIFVMPKYEDIFLDFKIPLPAVTRALLDITRNEWFQQSLSIVALIWLGQMLAGMLSSRERRFFGNLLHGVYYYIPILHRQILDRGMAGLCETVAGAVAASWPLDRTLREAADMQDNALLHRRINKWADQITAGLSTSDAARKARLPDLISAMLAPARSADDLAQALVFLARHYQTRYDRARIILHAAYIPIVVTIMGICVGFVALSMFVPMVDLIQATSNAYTSYR